MKLKINHLFKDIFHSIHDSKSKSTSIFLIAYQDLLFLYKSSDKCITWNEQIVRALEGDVSLSDLNEGIKPGQSNVYSSYGSSDYDTSQYNEDLKKFRKMALGSQEYGASSEYSTPTSEYGLYPSGSSSGEGQTSREMEKGKLNKNSQGFSGNSQLNQVQCRTLFSL